MMNYIQYMKEPFQPIGFAVGVPTDKQVPTGVLKIRLAGITSDKTPTKEELILQREELARSLVKKENNIVTETDRLNSEIETSVENATTPRWLKGLKLAKNAANFGLGAGAFVGTTMAYPYFAAAGPGGLAAAGGLQGAALGMMGNALENLYGFNAGLTTGSAVKDAMLGATGEAVLGPMTVKGMSWVGNKIAPILNMARPYTKGVLNRTKEAILREGDYLKDAARNWLGVNGKGIPIFSVDFSHPMFPTWRQLFNRNTLKYIFNPKADPNLAYQMPYKYSGQQFLDDYATSLAHKDDLIDIVMGKSNVLRDEAGNLIGELTSDTRYIPLETLDQLTEMTDDILVLRPTDNMSQIVSSRGFGSEPLVIRNNAIAEGRIGQALPQRGNSPRIKVSKPGEFEGPWFVDPGHFGYSVWRGPNGYLLIGNDIYHYNLKRFGQTHLKTSVLPDANMSQPIIVQWPINFRKSGGPIHIKKKNKGKFTDYCGGKVTEECIRKGKNSSNPTTRKRANFAANARKWKHEEGGKLNYLNYFQHE